MLNITKLKKINPNDPNLKMLIPKAKGLYFWFDNATDKIVYIGTGSGIKGLYHRIISQHLNPSYIEYRAQVHNLDKDAYQLKYPIIRERDGSPGIDQSALRKNIGRTYKVKPGLGTVNFIKENFYLKFIEVEKKEELITLEKQLIFEYKPKLNISHKYKMFSNTENIKLSNFRKIKDTWNLDLAPITFFTGKNNSGKSTVIKSLLLIEDYTRSNNHLELHFQGENFYKHKIESFKNAINRVNLSNSKNEILFEYKNKGFNISILLQPDEHFLNGVLKNLKLVRSDGATIKLNLLNTNTYQLEVDALFFNENDNDKNEEENENQEILDLFETTSSFIYGYTKTINKLKAEVENLKKEIQLIILGENSRYTDSTFDLKDTEKVIINLKTRININEKEILEFKIRIQTAEKKLKILQKKRNQIVHKSNHRLTYSPIFSVDEFDSTNRRIDKIIRTVLPKYLVDNNLGNKKRKNDFKNSDESLEMDKANKLGDEILSALSFNIKHLSPHRSNQSKLFIHENRDVDINYLIKQYSKNQMQLDKRVKEFMGKWMSEEYFDIGNDYRITTYESTVSKIEIEEDNIWFSLSDKGFGAGQLFSILLSVALSIMEKKEKTFDEYNTSIIAIEEPEANLHPKLQSKLAELFLDAYVNFGIRFILETHSEYMIRMSQIIVKQINEKEENAQIPFEAYYFDKDAEPYCMIYRKDGKFTNEFGSGFFDVSSNLAFDIL
jgi:predicted ATPase